MHWCKNWIEYQVTSTEVCIALCTALRIMRNKCNLWLIAYIQIKQNFRTWRDWAGWKVRRLGMRRMLSRSHAKFKYPVGEVGTRFAPSSSSSSSVAFVSGQQNKNQDPGGRMDGGTHPHEPQPRLAAANWSILKSFYKMQKLAKPKR